MKTITLFLFIILVGLISCKESTLTVKNRLPNTVIRNVSWANESVANEMLPNADISKDFDSSVDDLPNQGPIVFEMFVNGRRVRVESRESFRLEKDDMLEIVIDSSMQIK